MSLAELKEVFVNSFPNSETQHTIFASYCQFVEDFTREICPVFTHWIDGSFITNKLNPNDMDFVVHVEDLMFETNVA